MNRFWSKVAKAGADECWLWTASVTKDGYGRIGLNGKVEMAHRLAYMLCVGPVPSGLELDHLCRVPACVNPSHLEAVTHRENCIRRNFSPSSAALVAAAATKKSKTHCPSGHPYSGDNLYTSPAGRRSCRTCTRASKRRFREKAKSA